MLLVLAGWGCAIDCGSAQFVTAGDALAKWDADGDGATADLIERCGPSWGSFGFRRHDLGLTKLLFSPNVPSGKFEEDLEIASLLLPAAEVSFYSEHLVAGAVIGADQLTGGGVSKLHGTIEPGYVSYGLLDGTVTVLEGPGKVPGAFPEDEAERWRFQWDLTLGDTQSGATIQEWHATDVIDVANGTEIGDELSYPADWDGPHPD